MRSRKSLIALTMIAMFLISLALLANTSDALAAGRPGKGQCNRLPASNADALEILSNYYPGYWWDHTDITIAVQAHPDARTSEHLRFFEHIVKEESNHVVVPPGARAAAKWMAVVLGAARDEVWSREMIPDGACTPRCRSRHKAPQVRF